MFIEPGSPWENGYIESFNVYPWDKEEEWYFTGGPHSWSQSGGSGIDFAPPRNISADKRYVRSVADGKIIDINKTNPTAFGGCGFYVIIEHDHGWKTMYCHLDRISKKLKFNKSIRANEIIGIAG